MKAIFGMIFYLSLYVGRYLGAVGVLGLIAYPFGWYRHDIWLWLGLIVLGIFSAYLLDEIKKEAEHVRRQGHYR